MAAYNAEATVAEALDSLLAQTRSDWEAIVADDGSTDSTREIVAAYAERDPRITLVSQVNGGTGSARNTAASHATAALLSLLDSDDVYLPEYFERMGAFIEQHPDYDIYSSDGYLFRAGEAPVPDDLQPDGVVRSYTADDFLARNRIRVLATVRRRAFDLVGGFDEDRSMAMEDYDFWLRAVLSGAAHIHNPERLWEYRLSEGQKTSDLRVGLRADLHMFERLLAAGAFEGPRHRAALLRRKQLARDLAIVEGRALRAELEARLGSGITRGARSFYWAARRGYSSRLKFALGLPVMLVSPRALARLMPRR
jgi:glycosyltransferase involved in cell wall biosynthesis